jgi:hypothetical protein
LDVIKGSLASIVLVIMIVMQSFSAMAETSQTHQIDIEHLQTEHSHSEDANRLDNNTTDEHETQDCHHCGHCSGSHLVWILVKNVSNSTNIMSYDKTPYPCTAQKEFSETTLRPPIS